MQNYKKALFALALSAFCMGVTEFVMAGVLVDVEAYFSVDAKTAGYLTTLYALGVVIRRSTSYYTFKSFSQTHTTFKQSWNFCFSKFHHLF